MATSTHGYDAIGRLTSLSHKQSAIDLASYTWEYDAHSRLTKVTSPDGTTTYSYDTTDQLTGADHSDQTDEAYSYDLNGNRTNTGYQTDTNNRLVSDGTYNYAYDSEGNRTRKTTIATGEYVEYAWDHRNRLTAVTYKTSTSTVTKKVEYDYDVFDRRIAKRVDETLGTAGFDREYRYVYDGEDIVLVYDGTGSLENRYLHGPGIDEVFADENALGEILWALTDNQGTVRDWAKSDGTIANHVTYDAFGEITGQTSATHEPLYAYTGREWDADAGMYYYRARWYDAAVGRFVSEDPIGFEADDPNLSRYVLNSPTNSVDPSGLILDRLRRLRDIVMDLPSQWRGLTATQRGLLLDAAQLGLDVGGIFEPTPFCDGANAAISLFRRDWMGAGLSGLGIIPYVGDLGKAGKIPRYVDRVQEALRMARGNPAFARVLQPILENLSGILGEVPLDRLPDSACRPLQNLQRQIDDYLEAAERLRRKLAALEDAQRGAVRSRSLPDGRIRYYGPERPARRPGPTRGASFVTEWDPRTGRVRQWMESYDQIGRVNRVHPKMIDGQVIDSPHYPPTGSESGR